jgi:hypothetical protein
MSADEQETVPTWVPSEVRGAMTDGEPAGRYYDGAVGSVRAALAATKEELRRKRAERDELNTEIKLLVAEEELLNRMARVTEAKPK